MHIILLFSFLKFNIKKFSKIICFLCFSMNNSNIAEQEDLIKESLFTLVKKHIPSAQFSDIDEIVLSYVVSILEDLGSEVDVQVK